MDAKYLNQRLGNAGRVLMCVPRPDVSRSMELATLIQRYAAHYAVRLHAPPTARELNLCRQAMQWLDLIPAEHAALRRLLESRMLTCPITGRPIYSWRKLAGMFHVPQSVMQRRHEVALGLLAACIKADLEMQDRIAA